MKTKITIYILPVLLLCLPPQLQAQQLRWHWAVQAVSGGNSRVSNSACDTSGNIYLTGSFSDTLHFGHEVLAPVGNEDLYIAKFNPQGEVLWAKQGGSTTRDIPTAFVVADGAIYTAGSCGKDASFGDKTAGDRRFNFFISKHDPEGETKWVKTFGIKRSDHINTLNIDSLGDIYFSGYFEGKAFIAKLDTSDNPTFTPVEYEPNKTYPCLVGEALEISSTLPVGGKATIVGGNFSDSLDIGTHRLYSHGGNDMFVAAIDSMGNPVWHKHLGSVAYDRLFELLQHPAGHIIATGLYSGTLICDNDTLGLGNTSCDVFTASFSPEGRLQEVNAMGGQAEEFPQTMTHDRQGHIFVAGIFRDTTQLRHHTLTTVAGIDEIFLAKLYHCNKNKIIFACDTVFPEGSRLTLEVKGGYEGYEWDNGASTSANYVVTCSKTYQVLVSDSLQCVYRDSITIRQSPTMPKVQIRAEVIPQAGKYLIIPKSTPLLRTRKHNFPLPPALSTPTSSASERIAAKWLSSTKMSGLYPSLV